MNLAVLYHAAVAHVPLALGVGVLGLGFLFPAVSLPIARWLLGAARGRCLLAAVIVAGVLCWQWEARFSAGYAAAVTEQKGETARAVAATQSAALAKERALGAAMFKLAFNYETRMRDAQAQHDAVVADLRAGALKLRDHWTCNVSGPASSPGERDAAAERRFQGAGDLVRVADEADAQLAACQAVIQVDRAQ